MKLFYTTRYYKTWKIYLIQKYILMKFLQIFNLFSLFSKYEILSISRAYFFCLFHVIKIQWNNADKCNKTLKKVIDFTIKGLYSDVSGNISKHRMHKICRKNSIHMRKKFGKGKYTHKYTHKYLHLKYLEMYGLSRTDLINGHPADILINFISDKMLFKTFTLLKFHILLSSLNRSYVKFYIHRFFTAETKRNKVVSA